MRKELFIISILLIAVMFTGCSVSEGPNEGEVAKEKDDSIDESSDSEASVSSNEDENKKDDEEGMEKPPSFPE